MGNCNLNNSIFHQFCKFLFSVDNNAAMVLYYSKFADYRATGSFRRYIYAKKL